MNLQKRLELARVHAGYKERARRRAYAKALSVSYETVRLWEEGKKDGTVVIPRESQFQRIHKLSGLELAWLQHEVGPMTKKNGDAKKLRAEIAASERDDLSPRQQQILDLLLLEFHGRS